jgi:hypothetical protein
MEIIDGKDPELWRIAQKRAKFRKHLFTYIVINSFFWLLWLFSHRGMHFGYFDGGLPWPVWPMLGWGIGLAFNYFDAYHNPNSTLAEKEYEKLKREQERK